MSLAHPEASLACVSVRVPPPFFPVLAELPKTALVGHLRSQVYLVIQCLSVNLHMHSCARSCVQTCRPALTHVRECYSLHISSLAASLSLSPLFQGGKTKFIHAYGVGDEILMENPPRLSINTS